MVRALAPVVVGLLALSCSTSPGPGTTGPERAGAMVQASGSGGVSEAEALQLLLVDRQLYEPYTVDQSLLGEPAQRRGLARALGRITDSRTLAPLEGLLEDSDVEVRREAAFALGQQEAPSREASGLFFAAADADSEVGRLAVEALGKWGRPVEEVENALVGLPVEEAWSRLLPSLFRFEESRTVALAIQARDLEDPELRRWAAYALCRNPRPEGRPAIRGLLGDPSAEVRAWAARALGRVGDPSDLERLRTTLDDEAEGPVVQALRAARALVESDDGVAPDSWRGPLRERLDDPRVGVRTTATAVAGLWLLDEALSQRLSELVRSGSERRRELAFDALVEGEDPMARDLLGELAASPSSVLRAAAARGAVALGIDDVARELAADPEARVRMAHLAAVLDREDEVGGAIVARHAFADPDPMVRASALHWLSEHPLVPFEPLVVALREAWNERAGDARLAAVAALRARAESSPDERGPIVLVLLELADHPEFLFRRSVIEAIEALEEEKLAVGEATKGLGSEAYRDLLIASRDPARARLVLESGSLELELDCPRAPLTCQNFLQLARQGYYDGLVFHRVVPDFVVQTGDPRGDGWGGPGYAIRDEINRRRYEAGTLGMALSGPDTGGSQFFVTLAAQPHLDGGYTAFGHVVSGLELLTDVEQGDRIVSLRPIEEEAPPPLPRRVATLQHSPVADVVTDGRGTD